MLLDMSLGFIIIRHVNSKITDYYWKECYTCIRKFYDNPIIIIDDSSNKEFLNENIYLSNCDIIYDTEHKGSAELLPYYYFHKLKPFDTAVIIHDSVFIQDKIDFQLDTTENIRFLWNFRHCFNDEIFHIISEVTSSVEKHQELLDFYNEKHQWIGAFGTMSVIKWSFLDKINENHQLFERLLTVVKNRMNRHALERVMPLIAYYNDKNIKPAFFGDIHQYFGVYDISFFDYLINDCSRFSIMKVWTGR
jgi:hypothetical protein